MIEEYWTAILKDEDRKIRNSDRKHRYHFKSLESMSEELAFQEQYLYIPDDFTVQCGMQGFIDTVQNERLADGLRHLTDRQRQAIELHFWKGYRHREIAVIFGCDPSAVSHMMNSALKRLRIYMTER